MMTQVLTHRRFTLEDYYRMQEAGILTEDDRVELIEGEIVQMAPIGSRHAAGVKNLANRLGPLVQGRALIAVQDPVRLGPGSEPQPDFALLRLREDSYASAHPAPADILLLVEVADASLGYDRDVKVPLYAQAKVPEVWLMDLESDSIAVHREPSSEGYRSVQILRRGQRLSLQAFPDVSIAVDDLLP